MSFVADLEPAALWRHFDEILKIPRGSKNEEKMRQYVIKVAERNGLKYKVDETGNVVVRKPGTSGHEKAATTILQSHLDMVNDKNSDVVHDFDKDPIKPRRDGEYLKATGTTLGSDNGIGVAAMLAIMDARDLTHGPLELLFTIDEETGLTGAGNLGKEMLEGKQLLNLDTEEENALYVGCAGGADSAITLVLRRTAAPAASAALELKFSGLRGGHSGVDIHLQRGNATQLLARALAAAHVHYPFQLARLEGGNKHNAIPREAFATVVIPGAQKDQFQKRLQAEIKAIQDEFRPADPEMKLESATVGVPAQVWDMPTTQKVLNLLVGLPHGVQSMSYDIPGLVETSTNLATVNLQENELVIGMSSRSSVASALAALRQKIRCIGELAGAKVEEGNGYPGWKPNMKSHLLQVMQALHTKVLGVKPEVKAIHAGLETGIIGEKYPGMDMISFGPQIEFPHSPDERVLIPSVHRFYTLLTATLEALA